MGGKEKMIENLMYLLFSVVAVAVLGLFCYLLIFIAGYFEGKEKIRERRAKVRKEFKREINDLRADDGVHFEIFDERKEAF